jgi:S-layer protein
VSEATGTGLVTVNISGATALTLETVDDTVTTVDGSTATGAITLGKGGAILVAPAYTTFQAAGDLKFVKTGTGNDTITFGGTLTATDFDSTTANEGVDAGTGTDTVQMYLAGSLYSTGFAMTGVEVLKIAATAVSTVNLAEANALTSVVNDTNAAAEVITLSTCATIPDLTFTGDGVAAATQPFDGFTFSFASAVTTGTSDDMAIAVANRGTSLSDGFVYTIGALTIPGVETFTLAISDSPDSTTVAGITATEIKSLTITGSGDVLLGTVGGATTDAMTTFNASAVTGKLGSSTATVVLDSVASSAAVTTPSAARAWISLAGSSGSTISLTTGSAADTITGSAQADTIVAGADDDTITGGAGSDLITPGTGVDTVVLDYSLAGAAVDTITGFVKGSAGDQLDVDLSALETAGTSGINAGASDFVELQDASSTADTDTIVIQELTADAAAVANTNVFVLVGATYANTGAVETELETGAREITGVAVAVAVGDAFLVVYSDGTDAYLAAAYVAVDSGADLLAADLTIVNLAKLSGITSIAAADFHIANFDFVP